MPSMPSFATSAALVATASLAYAVPHELVGRSTFSVQQVAVGKVLKSGPLAMMKTYEKYAVIGAVAPANVVSAAAAVQSGEVVATPSSYDESYICPVTVGSQTLHLDFDTGSSDLYVNLRHACHVLTNDFQAGYSPPSLQAASQVAIRSTTLRLLES